MPVDYVWFKHYKKKERTKTTWTVDDCQLFPRKFSDTVWPRYFEPHSDHRPLTAFFDISEAQGED